MQKKVQAAFVGLFCLLIFCNAQAAADSAHRALSLFSGTVVPSLFPFAVAASLLFELHALDPLARRLHRLTQRCFGFSGHFAYLFGCSALSGYPIGAKLTADLFRQDCLSREEAEHLRPDVSLCRRMPQYAARTAARRLSPATALSGSADMLPVVRPPVCPRTQLFPAPLATRQILALERGTEPCCLLLHRKHAFRLRTHGDLWRRHRPARHPAPPIPSAMGSPGETGAWVVRAHDRLRQFHAAARPGAPCLPKLPLCLWWAMHPRSNRLAGRSRFPPPAAFLDT